MPTANEPRPLSWKTLPSLMRTKALRLASYRSVGRSSTATAVPWGSIAASPVVGTRYSRSCLSRAKRSAPVIDVYPFAVARPASSKVISDLGSGVRPFDVPT